MSGAPVHHSIEGTIKVLGIGSYGCVVMTRDAPLKCELKCEKECEHKAGEPMQTLPPLPDGYVSKLAFTQESKKALENEYRIITDVDPDSSFTLPLLPVCTVERTPMLDYAREECKKQAPWFGSGLGLEIEAIERRNLPIFQLVMPRANNSVHNYLGVGSETTFPCSFWVMIILKLFDAIDVLSQKGYIHGDLKPLNMVIATTPSIMSREETIDKMETCTFALIDFGSARNVAATEDNSDMQAFSAYAYTPPECCKLKIRSSIAPSDNYNQIIHIHSKIFDSSKHKDPAIAHALLKPFNTMFASLKKSSEKGDIFARSSVLLDAEKFNAFQLGVTIAEILASVFSQFITNVNTKKRMVTFDKVETNKEFTFLLSAVNNLIPLITTMCSENPAERPSIHDARVGFFKCFLKDDNSRSRFIFDFVKFKNKFKSPSDYYGFKSKDVVPAV